MPTLTKGNLLVAEPSVVFDKSFNRSVILLTEHNKKQLCRLYSQQKNEL